jgi:predicted amidophosphoribosyltransferase
LGYGGCRHICVEKLGGFRHIPGDPKKFQEKYKSRSLYAAGFKRCSLCQVFYDTKEPYCKCCGRKLRIHPRGYAYNNKKIWTKKKDKHRI